MIVAILIGRDGSIGLPKKNVYPLLNRPLMSYPLLAAKNSKFVDDVYVSTDSKDIMDVAKKLGAKTINRPPELATSKATVESAFVHAYEFIKSHTKEKIEFCVILMCNAVSVLPKTIDNGVEILRSKKACEFIGEKGRIQGLEMECLARLHWVWKMGDEKWMKENWSKI